MKTLIALLFLSAAAIANIPPEAKDVASRAAPQASPAEVVARVRPAVVHLKTMRQSAYSTREVSSAGVVVSRDGLVVTCDHCVRGGLALRAVTDDGRSLGVQVVRSMPESDLALLRLPPGIYSHLPISSREARPGDLAMAVGHPYGYDWSATQGMVAAVNRTIELSGSKLSGIVQTSLAINPGYSGGPLLSMNGELVGINLAMHDTGQGIGFAHSAATVAAFVRGSERSAWEPLR